MRSSYIRNHYGTLFKALIRTHQPKTIVEFGILDGYSLDRFLEEIEGSFLFGDYPGPVTVRAYDIFDDFPYHAASSSIAAHYPGVVQYGDYYKLPVQYESNSIDLLHIDIANDGDVYRFFFEHWLDKLSPSGFALIEGGSAERDVHDWMVKYNKPKIRPVLEHYRNDCDIFVFEPFPSVTMVKKRK